MKKLLRPLSLCAIACLAIGSAAQAPRLQKTSAETRPALPHPTAKAVAGASAESSVSAARAAAYASSNTEFVLIDEDFSGFKSGTPENPLCNNSPENEYMDVDNVAASYYVNPPGAYIESYMTQEDGWSGDWVYEAGGCALLYGQANSWSRINTPVGDYSGDITVTAKIKAFPCSYVTSEINIIPIVGGIINPDYANTDDPDGYYSFRLRDEEDWVEISYSYRNYSADADGFIMFSVSGAILIDYIKVTCNPNNFLAEPKVNAITNVRNDEMTLNWDPVDRAFGYRIWLWKVNYLSDTDAEYTEDFESANALTDTKWTYDLGANSGIVENGGASGNGLLLNNGDMITAPEYMAKYYNITCYIKAEKESRGYLYIDVKKGDQWSELGYMPLYYFGSGDTFDLDYEMWGEFALAYDGVRFRIADLADGESVVIDNLYAKTTRPGELELQCLWPEFADEPDLKDYWYGEVTGKNKVCEYQLTDLDPMGDYYYKIDSQRIHLFSESTMQHAFVIASPELEEATDIDAQGSYTANWEPVAKADSYTAINYGAVIAQEDGMLTLLEEDFSKVTSDCGSSDPYSPVDMGNYWGDMSLDEYTQLPGWTGTGTTLAEGCMGVVEAFYVESYLRTPALYLANNDWFAITLVAYGQPSSDLSLKYGDYTLNLSFDENGVLDLYIVLSLSGKDQGISFFSQDYAAFVIDYLKIEQEVKAGAAALTYLSSVTVDDETSSVTFTDLTETGFTDFAYTVVAHMTQDGVTADSTIDQYMLVDLENGHSGPVSSIETVEVAVPATEVARYSINGTQVDSDYRGIVIIRYSDGTARKIMQK